jgi:Tol biopolymer transport system component/DNA-binding winged helix-turn-helix (wHTH) protein
MAGPGGSIRFASPVTGLTISMDSSKGSQPSFAFGPYEADLPSGELRKNGFRIKIQDLPFRLMSVLAENPGRVVAREELQKRLWPDDTFVDFEDALNTAVKKLREALCDDAEKPRYVETVPRHGYRFIAQVKIRNGGNGTAMPQAELAVSLPATAYETASHPGAAPAILRRRASDRVRWQIRAVSGGAIVTAAFLLWWCTPLPPPQVTRIEHLTTAARIDTPVRLVSDGARLYYMERDGDHWNLMQTAASGGEGQRVETGATNALAMDVSPDLSELLIGTFEVRGAPNRLWTIPSQGGAPMRFRDVIANSAIFSPDGKQIAYLKGSDLWMMDANGSNAHLLATLPGAPFWPAWSPDGQTLRFTLPAILSGEGTSIWEISSDGSNLHELLPGWTHPGAECCGSWTSDGRYFTFTSSRGGLSNLWALRERGSVWRRSARGPFQLTFGPDTPWGATPSRDGRHIFFYNGARREDLKRLDMATGQFSNLAPNSGVMHVSFSRDGKWIAYIDAEHGGLFRSRLDGTDRVELTGHGENVSFPRWSPDGKWVLFGGITPSGMSTSYLIPALGGVLEPLLKSQTEVRDADWSGDGRKIVLARSRGTKDSDGRELQIVDFATRKTETMPDSENMAMSRWSYDGRFVAATQQDQRQLKLWDVARRQWRVIARGKALGISVWSPDSQYLYFQDLLGKGEQVWRYNMRLERVEPVVEFSEILKSGVGRCALFGATPDGSLVVAFNRGTYDLFAASVTLP